MSMPKFPEENNINREEAVNLILTSIGMEELGLSHILNAEGEKLQYALGTLEGAAAPDEPLKIEDLLNLNQSVRETLGLTIQNQLLLNTKLGTAKSMPTMQGPAGPAGPQGEQGITGSQGPQGNEGPAGPQGLTGPPGTQGPQGEQGIPGENGFSGIIVRGNYDPAKTYSINDYVVSDQGNGFVAHVNNPANSPPEEFVSNDEWTAFVAAGAPGKQGVQGPQGQIGATGPAGPRGAEGSKGEQGIQGSPGSNGADGKDGKDGKNGEAATIKPGTVTMLRYDEPPTVENAGTSTNAIFNFGIPEGPPRVRVYRANLSAADSRPLEIPLGNAINYQLQYSNADELRLFFRPIAGLTQARCDYRIVSQYNATTVGITSFDAYQGDAAVFTQASPAVDVTIYNSTRETHKTWIRVQNPSNTALWSAYEVNLLSSQNGARVLVWVNVIDENGSY